MSLAEPTIESKLRRAMIRWRALQFIGLTALVGAAGCGLFLLLGFGLVREWITSVLVAELVVCGILGLLFLAWVGLLFKLRAKSPSRVKLAGALEGANQGLLDRLNTLVFLERQRRSDRARWFFTPIARQAGGVLAEQTKAPFGFRRTLTQCGLLAMAVAVTVTYYVHYSPWDRLLVAQSARASRAVQPEKAVELALPTNNVAEEHKVWGEVRITDPARDLKVTKVDVVPLQIEAAANQTLKSVAWYSTVNGAAELAHDLPAPAEPRYAVYQPNLYLDEFRLADWDVLTYYAGARTEHGEPYASEVFFIEVRPFREDILKLPGGEGGKAYAALSEMTGLIERQQHVIRETHRYQQAISGLPKLREQDRRKLAEAEDDLSVSARHLYARMATEMENQSIGEALDHLAKAARTLASAAESLQKEMVPEAQKLERAALLDLVATRKMFQKAVSDHPGDFSDPTDEKADEPPPLAESTRKLSEIAEFRNEAKAAQDFVQKAIEQQKRLAAKAASALRTPENPLATEEKALADSLAEFKGQHPQVFQGVTNEFKAAQQGLVRAAEALQKKAGDARSRAESATGDLENLATAMANRSAGRELADSYRLKQLLDQQVQRMDQIQKSTNHLSTSELEQAAANSQATLEQLRQVVENKPTSDAFGPQLKQSLTGTNQAALEMELNRLAHAQDAAGQQAAAAEAKGGLARVSQAFGESEPSALQGAHKNDALKPGEQESFDRGLAQLESLKQHLESGHKVPGDQQAQLREEAFRNLSRSISTMFGTNSHAQDVMLLLDHALKDHANPLDLALLKKLMDQLRTFSIEVADQKKPADKPDMTSIDPARLPPAYRGRIEKYYQKLSEQKP